MARVETTSPWRLQAREIITAALATLPPDASEAQKRAALRVACPWHRRRSGDGNSHGYRMWRIECRLALGLPAKKSVLEKALRATPQGIECPHCFVLGSGPKPRGGCLLCCGLVARFLALTNAEIETWDYMNEEAIKGDAAASAALTDWLIEHGLTEESR